MAVPLRANRPPYAHSWAEEKRDGEWVVIDRAKRGSDAPFPRKPYYKIMGFESVREAYRNRRCRRYGLASVVRWVQAKGYAPWQIRCER